MAKPKKQKEAKQLRKKGKSYREIAEILKVSKNSVSRWCKEVDLPESAKEILEEKQSASIDKLREYNRQKHEEAKQEHCKIRERAAEDINSLSKYEILLIGTALYWGEGYKNESTSRSISLANSDPFLIAVYLRFLKEVLEIPESKIRARILIHSNINPSEAVEFWSEVTGFPNERFSIDQQTSRASKGKRPSNRLPHGTLLLRLCDYEKYYKIKGWIKGLEEQSDYNG